MKAYIDSDNNDLVELNNKCLKESILNCDKTNFVNSDNTDFSDLNNNCFSESIKSDNIDFGECSNESVNSDNPDPDLNKCLENDSKAGMFNILALNCCGLKINCNIRNFRNF